MLVADSDVASLGASVDELPFACYGFRCVNASSDLVLLFLSCQRLFCEESMVGILFRIRRCKMERFCFSSNLDIGRSLSWLLILVWLQICFF